MPDHPRSQPHPPQESGEGLRSPSDLGVAALLLAGPCGLLAKERARPWLHPGPRGGCRDRLQARPGPLAFGWLCHPVDQTVPGTEQEPTPACVSELSMEPFECEHKTPVSQAWGRGGVRKPTLRPHHLDARASLRPDRRTGGHCAEVPALATERVTHWFSERRRQRPLVAVLASLPLAIQRASSAQLTKEPHRLPGGCVTLSSCS